MKTIKITLVAVMLTIFMGSCGSNGGGSQAEPQTPCNNPQVLAETFANYMQSRDYENAALLFAEFCDGGYSVMDLYYKTELLKIGNMYADLGSPAKVDILEQSATSCRIKTTIPWGNGGEWNNYLTLKKVNDCWQIADYSTK